MTVENPHHSWLLSELAQIRTYAFQAQNIDMQSRLIIDLHLDSLEMLELVSSVEKQSQQPLEDTIWMAWYRVQDVLDYLEAVCPMEQALS
ncbi:acyl carrier protein [Yersinia mollaretii]|uniref:Acyl carrier protein n=1 Tax=Yersinia mollaretii (strain ATCC 43969 / DSM 18520 / CIP 103324 / CNY 7263 / WAIP 204) TaxID=349967 RepID=A0ABM9YD70_YERMW|nr:acyl carrier protein [Yersinia mollaretii]EEQ11859.1 hypothetical protein ymoll0001_4450 [Yersinia mollaretii ATCC 43969]MDN0112206.1 acyl carrier protein [Yersinia mollaretii]QKJ02837.1 acyl carrier protein [Yersinia mollaretii ATCC 43969]